VISWLVTRWRVVGGELQIDTGLVVRQSLRFPLSRVQAVDIVAPLTARVLGLAEVRVISAGVGHHVHGRLAYLRNQEAAMVRAQLLALAHGLAAETPEPPAVPLFRVENGRLIVASLLRGPVLWLLAWVAAAAALAEAATGPQGSPQAVTSLLSGALTGLLATGLEVARFVNTDFDFAVGEAPDGLRLHRGLLQKRHETVPYARVQAVRLIRPLLWRPFGWARVELDVARQAGPRREREAHQLARLLAPVSSLAEAQWLIARLMPGAPVALGSVGAAPPRALIRAPLSYHYLRAWHDQRYLVTQTGRVRPATVVVRLEKVQSIRWESGPLLRFLGLANLRVDTAGRRWVGEALCRDQAEAAALVEELSVATRQARRIESSRPAGSSPVVLS
jgi:putative membrane protein